LFKSDPKKDTSQKSREAFSVISILLTHYLWKQRYKID
jgi:hypothetical protein